MIAMTKIQKIIFIFLKLLWIILEKINKICEIYFKNKVL